MKAITLEQPGGVENLQYTDLPIPALQPGEVLIKTKSLSINPVDVKSRAGKGLYGRFKDFKPLILGWDISGEVAAVSPDVKDIKPGDAVFGMVNFPGHGQAYAAYVAAPAAHLALKPDNIPYEDAAAATLAALTAYQFLYHEYNIVPGQRVLIHAAAGGVGHYAVQLARLAGAYVIGTASAQNADFVKALGADEVIDYKAHRFEDVVSEVDFVLDAIGGENIDRSLKVIKKGGTIISIPSGLNADVVEKARALGIHGAFHLVASSGKDMQAIAALLAEGKLKSNVSEVFTFDQMREAHLALERGVKRGKIVINV
ncbi:oxidoreductase [Chitinophaga parva]|uniref:Oxidoreductase n=1 Tax=Chitinophaga parva TaxID=2169414 RepID=A0A2T7BET9_9BACT|nr:NADP-dependent oxidoreductase [Chitinophaga parva]PUZ24812.1 oxidoreductase [Chitinophaga parva]